MGENELSKALAKAKEIIAVDPEFKANIKALSSIRSFASILPAFKNLWWLVKRVAYVIEMVQKEYQLCTEGERIDVAAKFLDDLIEFKGWLSIFEPIDEWLWKMLISAGVQALNDKYGSGAWFNKVKISVL